MEILNHIVNWLEMPETDITMLVLLYPAYQFFYMRKFFKVSEIFDYMIGIAIAKCKELVKEDINKVDKKQQVIDFMKNEYNGKIKSLQEHDLIHIVDIAYNTYIKPNLAGK
jgi:hypothetical protein